MISGRYNPISGRLVSKPIMKPLDGFNTPSKEAKVTRMNQEIAWRYVHLALELMSIADYTDFHS
jgi:hypothetical protein